LSGKEFIMTVLIIDDHTDTANAIAVAVQLDIGKAIVAKNTAAALQILASQSVDVIVLDHFLPGMSGLGFLSLICEQHIVACELPVIMYSSDRRVRVPALALGAVAFVEKNAPLLELIETIDRYAPKAVA
jgi:DNA-binding NtrC family response regulator